MPIPHVFLPVKPQDTVVTPFKVHKLYQVTNTDWSSSGYTLQQGVYAKNPTPISSSKAANDPKNPDGTYQHIVWQAINQRYYKYPYDPTSTFEHSNENYTYKKLFESCSILSAPYLDAGEGIKPGSVEITSSGIYLKDDGFGNLYDISLSGSNWPNRNNLIFHLSFDDKFKYTKFGRPSESLKTPNVEYRSFTFEPSEKAQVKNITLLPGLSVLGTGSGYFGNFSGIDSYVRVPNNDNLNLNGDFSLIFDYNLNPTQSLTETTWSTLISKRGVSTKTIWDKETKKYTSKTIDDKTNVFPFEVAYLNASYITETGQQLAPRRLYFIRSDGIKKLYLPISNNLSIRGISGVTFDNSSKIVSAIIDGVISGSVIDRSLNPFNFNDIVIGSSDLSGSQPYQGSLNNIRLYNKVLSSAEISTLTSWESSGSTVGTATVGNVFYKNGTIVVTSPYKKYKNIFSGSWNMKYRNTHTIYEYKTLCRIKKGSANFSMNPTARQSYDSDLLLNDFTGSFLKPYITSVGLYNDAGELLAVGKLGQPIQTRTDVDLNILIRWDV